MFNLPKMCIFIVFSAKLCNSTELQIEVAQSLLTMQCNQRYGGDMNLCMGRYQTLCLTRSRASHSVCDAYHTVMSNENKNARPSLDSALLTTPLPVTRAAPQQDNRSRFIERAGRIWPGRGGGSRVDLLFQNFGADADAVVEPEPDPEVEPEPERERSRNTNNAITNGKSSNSGRRGDKGSRGRGGRTHGRDGRKKGHGRRHARNCDELESADDKADCEAFKIQKAKCKEIPGTAQEKKRCVREAKCSRLEGELKADCLSKKRCCDFVDEQDRIRCRVERRCSGLTPNTPEMDSCVQRASMNCFTKTGVDREQCRFQRLCGSIADDEDKQSCIEESKDRCSQLPEGDDREDCYDERRAKKCDRKRLNRLQSQMNNQMSRDLRRNQMSMSKRVRPDFADRDRNSISQQSETSVNALKADEYFDGDIHITDRQLNEIQRHFNRRNKRKVGRQPTFDLWQKMPISYQFEASVPPATREIIRQAIQKWQSNTCVRFVENGPDTDRIEFYHGGGCSSYVGRTGGTQSISISTPGCAKVGIVSHELGHALGFLHEQARPDQNKHVSIAYQNIPTSRWNNFLPADISEVDYKSMSYDMGSVLHYEAFAFTKNQQLETIQTLDPYYQKTIGQRMEPSFIDYGQINAAYCSTICSNAQKSALKCEHGGYLDPNNCKMCKCPSGFGGILCDAREPTTKCGADIKVFGDQVTIMSPNYPNNFARTEHCVWRIVTSPGHKISLKFVDTFDFNCKDSCDVSHVEIKNGADWAQTGYRFCCSKRPDKIFESASNEMIVMMRNSGLPPGKGFKAVLTSTAPRPTNVVVATAKPTAKPTTVQPVTVAPATAGEASKKCECKEWSAWSGSCTQSCGGCGRFNRKRSCTGSQRCYSFETKRCNFAPCAASQSLLTGNREFHFLLGGCCLGLFRNGAGQCSGGGSSQINQIFGSLSGLGGGANGQNANMPAGQGRFPIIEGIIKLIAAGK